MIRQEFGGSKRNNGYERDIKFVTLYLSRLMRYQLEIPAINVT